MSKYGLLVLVVAFFWGIPSIAQRDNSQLEETLTLETLEQDNFVIEELIINQLYSKKYSIKEKEHWFCVTPEETGSYVVSVNGQADFEVVLLDNTRQNIITKSRVKVNGGEYKLAHTLLKGVNYYLRLKRETEIEEIPYSIMIEMLEKPNDEYFNQQWALMNDLNGLDINILPAWKCSFDKRIKIGIADTGTDYKHLDLKNQLDLDLSYNFTHKIKNIFPETEYNTPISAKAGHGTQVAGIIGAEMDNKAGIAGVSPYLKMVPLKVLGSRLSDNTVYIGSIAAFIQAVEYAKENNIKIINCSFGGTVPSVAEKEAMINAEGILFVIAAGNDGNDLSCDLEYPACYYHDNSLVVASMSQNGELSDSSNYGGPTEIVAPGEKIYSTLPGNSYGYEGGTSMAAPFVSAVAGLVWSNKVELSPSEVKQITIDENNVTMNCKLDEAVISNGGLLNAYSAVTSEKVLEQRNIKKTRGKMFKDVKADIKKYKERVDDNVMTNQVIIKLDKSTNIDDFLGRFEQEHWPVKVKRVGILESIDAYVLQFVNYKEADKMVDNLNTYWEIDYAEMNYMRRNVE